MTADKRSGRSPRGTAVEAAGWFRIGSVTKTFTAAAVLSLPSSRSGKLIDNRRHIWQLLPGRIVGTEDASLGTSVLELIAIRFIDPHEPPGRARHFRRPSRTATVESKIIAKELGGIDGND